MKTYTFLAAFSVLLLFSCSDDESTPIPTPDDEVLLKFNLETAQDQMGDFADNAMVEYDGEVFSVGGINDYSASNLNSDVWKSTNGKSWVSVTSDMFADRRGHTVTDFGGNIWLIGGYNIDTVADIWYSPDGMNWTELPPSEIPFRFGLGYHSTFIFGTKMYVYARGEGIWSTADGFSWILENADPFPVRGRQQTVVLNDVIYVISGSIAGSGPTNEIWQSTDAINWSLVTITGDIFSPREYFTATVYNDKIWIISGEDATDSPPNIWYSPNGSTWSKFDETFPLIARFGHVTLNYNGELWVFGGYDYSTGRRTGQIWAIKEI